MQVMLTVDPGLRGCGCAWWTRQGEAPWALHSAAHAAALPHTPGPGDDDGPEAWNAVVGSVELLHAERFGVRSPDILCVERMKVYTRGAGDPRDLLALMAVAGGIFRAFHDARPLAPLPSEYKGQVPRDIYGERVEKKVREGGEWPKIVVPKKKTHLNDVMHAVGMGLFLVERGRV